MSKAIELGWRNIWVESDSTAAVNVFHSDKLGTFEGEVIMEQIEDLSNYNGDKHLERNELWSGLVRKERFANAWTLHPSYLDTVKQAWNLNLLGNLVSILCQKLKALKHTLKTWSRTHFSDLSRRIESTRISMHTLQLLIQSVPFAANIAAEKSTKMICCELLLYEYEDIKQRAGTKWVVHGDKCTAYFHNIVKERKCRNKIWSITDEGGNRQETHSSVVEVLVDHYKSILVFGFICFTFVYYCEQYKLSSSEIPDICQVSSDECFIKNLQKSMKLTQDSVGSLEIELEQVRKRCLFLESLLEKFLTTDGNYNVWHSNTGFMNDSGMTHDEIQASSLEVIGGMMEKFQGGDYASVSSGGMVVAHSERWFSDRDTIQKGILFTDPRKILETSSGDPNECFCMKGSGGFVDIRLGTPVIPESITLEHFVIKLEMGEEEKEGKELSDLKVSVRRYSDSEYEPVKKLFISFNDGCTAPTVNWYMIDPGNSSDGTSTLLTPVCTIFYPEIRRSNASSHLGPISL
ncbi:hypothetical protein IFM89_039961 [Coptis chinensis]|uniref:SUN domain-containing protein n=1 Tax=Coptis chinensis TaxID=261450 RepID=A0A835L9C4_9MAGN|nr:hypothetical protein IFM89_039961 [Coptis chinensis]